MWESRENTTSPTVIGWRDTTGTSKRDESACPTVPVTATGARGKEEGCGPVRTKRGIRALIVPVLELAALTLMGARYFQKFPAPFAREGELLEIA